MEPFGYAMQNAQLDAVFAALSDPTRRAILMRLSLGKASVNELAAPTVMSQPAVSKHLRVLERAGLIEREAEMQKRFSLLKPQPLADAVLWLENFRKFWSGSFDQLDVLLTDLQHNNQKDKQNGKD